MSRIAHDIPDLDRKGLREFGLLMGGIIAGLFGLLLPWLLEHPLPAWPWPIAGTLALWALLSPDTMRPLYRLWIRFGLLLNRLTTPLILGVLFFVVITPVALVMRIAGRDSMARRLDEHARSYRVPSRKTPRESVERHY
jgi:hypothetical protein